MYDSINIIIPVYNEGDNIKQTLEEIEYKIKTPHKIFIVYDFDEDNTVPIIQNYKKSSTINIELVKNIYQRGALNAIKTGFEIIDNGIVLVIMADFSDDLSNVDEMFRKIIDGYDLVCGSRYMKGGKQIGGFWFKKALSRAAGISLHYLADIPTHDVTNSFKMYTKRILNDIKIESNGGFELGMEIVVKTCLKGYRITEVPTIWRDRNAGTSRFLLAKWLPKYVYWYLLAFKCRRRKNGTQQMENNLSGKKHGLR